MPRPFTIDPAATGAFARLRAKVGDAALHNTAAPVKAVVIGGGTGAPMSIRTLLSLEAETSAVVAMADDGGSTGILRDEAGALPPGDVRKCIAAMAADDSDALTTAFKYRFSFANNHTLGNLMLSALEDATGSFPEAIAICERLLDARGHVYPSTLDKVRLAAATVDGTRVTGQANSSHSRVPLYRTWLESSSPVHAYGPALDAVRQADLIVLGPGSLFTSIIPNLLVPGVIDAIRQSQGVTLFVCSLADMQGETWGMSALEHYDALCRHGMEGLVDYMLVHTTEVLRPDAASAPAPAPAHASHAAPAAEPAPSGEGAVHVRPVRITYDDAMAIQRRGTVLLARDLADAAQPTWHDPEALRDAMRAVIRLSRAQTRARGKA